MKKLFAFILAFLILFSGCGWNVEIVDPREETAELEKEEALEQESETKEELVEKIILDFGAEKTGEGTFRTSKTRGFLFESEVTDFSMLEMKYYFSWVGEKFRERYSDWESRFESPHGMGYSYPAEEFEEIIGTYFGASSGYLRSDKIFYCADHNSYCSPGGGAGFGEQYDVETVSYIKTEDLLTIEMLVGGARRILSVRLLENGEYRFLSYTAGIGENSEPEAEQEPEKAESLWFSFGGGPTEMKIGDSYANWTLEDAEITYDSSGAVKYISADFSADIRMTIMGYIERNPLFDLSENIYDFHPRAEDEGHLPHLCNTPFSEYSGHFILDAFDKIKDFPGLDYNERFPCMVTISSYSLDRGYTMTSDGAELISFIPLKGEAELTELQEEIILNFGARKTDFGAIEAKKTGSLYFNTEGYDNLSALGETSYFVWAMFYFGEKYDYETQKELFSGAGEGKGWAFPSEYYEPAVFEFFGVPAETLRAGEIYNESKDYYNIQFGGGIGDTPFIVVNSVEETAETVVFHLSLRHYFSENDCDMALTVKLLPEGGYNYVSYLPEA